MLGVRWVRYQEVRISIAATHVFVASQVSSVMTSVCLVFELCGHSKTPLIIFAGVPLAANRRYCRLCMLRGISVLDYSAAVWIFIACSVSPF